MKNFLIGSALAVIATIVVSVAASAHVVVSPNSAEPGAWQTFSVGVPNEKDNPTTKVVLQIPSGLQHVTPTVQPGFTIQTSKDGDNVTSITWTGNVPVGQRVDLSFSAQVPADVSELDWKADQYYADGSIVKWDQDPSSDTSDTPYSVTKVAEDTSDETTGSTSSTAANVAIGLSAAAVVLSLGALFIKRHR